MSVDEVISSKSDITDSMRLSLQASIIEQAGRFLICPQCNEKKWIMDWKEDCWKIMDRPRLRYICEKCNIVVVEASG